MNWGKIAAAVGAISCGVLVGSMLTTSASSIPPAGQPGSTEDPIVTKSYVDEQIQKALGGQTAGSQTDTASSEVVDKLKNQVAALEDAVKALQKNSQSGVPYAVIVMKPGQTLLGGMGTEFIVRTGKAIVTSDTSNGIPDLTDGVDLENGVQAPNNHLLMVPRQGRGLKADESNKGDVYVTVKGAYLHIGTDGNPV